jgi:hypothetical protein
MRQASTIALLHLAGLSAPSLFLRLLSQAPLHKRQGLETHPGIFMPRERHGFGTVSALEDKGAFRNRAQETARGLE